MADIAKRFAGNPILRPSDVKPSFDGLDVVCLLNPGAFRFLDKTWLLVRVAERPRQKDHMISTPILDPIAANGMSILEVSLDDPALLYEEPRSFRHNGQLYLTTLSHVRLASSEDGVNFRAEPVPTLLGQNKLEAYGIEDCRVSEIEGVFYLTDAAVSPYGIGVDMISATDWRKYTHHGMILPPTNKDVALFPAKIGDSYCILHRPSSIGLGGSFIWLSRSPDLIHWGQHDCIAVTRPGMWDAARIVAGDEITLYYGAADEVICGATLSIKEILNSLGNDAKQ
jgi:beta-1,2-mannobiose phosphorylase / 1,2-beta-oligomannan phosphorylase